MSGPQTVIRGRCTAPSCPCVGCCFQRNGAFADLPLNPSDTDELCVCRHSFYSHVPTNPKLESGPQNEPWHRLGVPERLCTQFFSLDEIWNATTRCICGTGWLGHARLVPPSVIPSLGTSRSLQPIQLATRMHPPQSPFTQTRNMFDQGPELGATSPALQSSPNVGQPSGHQQSSSSASWPYTLSHTQPGRTATHNLITAHRPISAFIQPQADSGAALIDRDISIHRNLPQYVTERRRELEISSRASQRTSSARGSTTAAPSKPTGSPRNQPPSRLTANPFDTVPLAIKFTIYILPFAIGEAQLADHPSPNYLLHADDIPPLLTALNLADLIFSATLPTSGEVWEHFHRGLMSHLNWFKIMLPGANMDGTAPPPSSFEELAWQIFTPSGTNPNTRRKFSPLSIASSGFTTDALKKIAKKVKNTVEVQVPMLFIIPKNGNLQRAIQTTVDPSITPPLHPCWAWRATQHTILSKGKKAAECFPVLCPKSDPTPTSSGAPVAQAGSSGTSGQASPTTGHVRQRSSDSDLVSDAPPPSTRRRLLPPTHQPHSAGHVRQRSADEDLTGHPPSNRRRVASPPQQSLTAEAPDAPDIPPTASEGSSASHALLRAVSPATLFASFPSDPDSTFLVPPSTELVATPTPSVKSEPSSPTAEPQDLPIDTPPAEMASIVSSSVILSDPALAEDTEDIPLSTDTVQPLSYDVLKMWCSRFSRYDTVLNRRFTAIGPSADAVAKGLVAMLAAKYTQSSNFETPAGVVCTSAPPYELFDPVPILRIGARGSDTPGVGDGPIRAVLRAAVETLTADTSRWGRRGAFSAPLLYGSNFSGADRSASFWAAGVLTAAHIIQTRRGPFPITPWLLRVAICGIESLDRSRLDWSYINALDPDSAKVLRPWFSISEDTMIDQYHAAAQLLIGYGVLEHEIQVMFSPRTPSLHAFIRRQLFSTVFLGQAAPQDSPDFKAFQEGLDVSLPVDLGGGSLLQKLRENPTIPHFVDRFLLSTFTGSKLTKVQQILDNLIFYTRDSADDAMLLSNIFKLRFIRYLHGLGHPLSSKGVHVTDAQFVADRADPLVRSQLFQAAISDNDLLPANPRDKFQIVLWGYEERDHDHELPHFHTCDYRMEVPLTGWLKNALKEPCSMLKPNEPTLFDSWLHSILNLTPGTYNRL